MNFWPECKTRVSVTISSFGSKAKMSQFSPNIFSTFYWFSGSLPGTVQHIKDLEGRFFVSARYGQFWLLTWSKMKDFDFFHKSKNFLSTINKWLLFYEKNQNSSFLTMSIVKIGHILPKRENAPPNFLYVVQYMANYQKINRKLKKYWGKIDSFLPWTQILKWTLRPSFCTQVKSSCVL